MKALLYMLSQYETLKTLSLIAEGSGRPTQYQATPHELLLQSSADWDRISSDLNELAGDSLVQITKADTLRFCITQKGIDKLRLLEGKPVSSTGSNPITYR